MDQHLATNLAVMEAYSAQVRAEWTDRLLLLQGQGKGIEAYEAVEGVIRVFEDAAESDASAKIVYDMMQLGWCSVIRSLAELEFGGDGDGHGD